MTRLKVDILNPKAVKLLQDLADMNLISISDISEVDLSQVNEPAIDYSKFQFKTDQLKFDRDEINGR